MARKKRGKGGKPRSGKRQKQKYMIYFVGAIMVLSGMFFGLNRAQNGPPEENPSGDWNVVEYESASLGKTSYAAKVVGITSGYKLVPNQMRFSEGDIQHVFETDIAGVTNVILEAAPGYYMFHFVADGDVEEGIRERIRLPGDYNLYRAYRASTEGGEFNVVGNNLEVGDYVMVVVLERVRDGRLEQLGFVEDRLEEGPVINGTAYGFESYSITGVSASEVPEEDLKESMGYEDVMVEEDNSSGDTLYRVSMTLPFDADVGEAREKLEGFDVFNVTALILGYSETAEHMVVNGSLVRIPNYRGVQSTFDEDTMENDTVAIRVYMLSMGGQTFAFATEATTPGIGVP
ncbi:MAG: hypothetical protein GF416_05795 [Candidatus Altiarchaeales archaeon]|nr:hypothetical protein [Candidatus Altiarchaeales archaeon]MBD3416628.1 hypothetical protein [Candidatus Altiarchaeales archaeon]